MSTSDTSSALVDLEFAMDFVNLALQDEDRSFDRALQRIVAEFNAFGCIVLERFDPDELDRSSSVPTLYTLATSSSSGKFLSVCDLPVEGTISGRALTTGEYAACRDVKKEGGPKQDHPYLVANNIGPIVSVPISFHDGKQGTFDLHRTMDQPPFSEDEIRRLILIAKQVPNLYRSRCERLNLKVVKDINRQADRIRWTQEAEDLKCSIGKCLDHICEDIANVFRALEVTVVLNDRIASTGCFKVRSTTWKGKLDEANLEYLIEKDAPTTIEHKTEWVIRNCRRIVLFDLRAAEAPEAEKRYAKLQLSRNEEFNREAIAQIKSGYTNSAQDDIAEPAAPNSDSEEIPPISYIAVPIVYEGHALGALRCCATTQVPHYFSERDASILELLASKIGQTWATFIQIMDQRDQVEARKRVVEGIDKAVNVVQKQIATEHPSFQSILKELLKITAGSLPRADCIELLKVDSRGATQELLGREFQHADPAAKPPQYYSIANAYITEGTTIIGQLRACDLSPTPTNTPEYLQQHLRLFAAQFGLYQVLIDQIGKQQKLRADVNERYQEIAHQLQGPLIQARDRADRMMRFFRRGDKERIREVDYAALRGLCRKALGVMRVLKVDTEGADHLTLVPKPKSHERAETVLKMILEEAAYDFELQYSRSGIVFDIDRKMLYHALGERGIVFDRELFEQVIYCIFENAMKYGDYDTKVLVTTRRESSRDICIEIANKGIPLSAEEAALCTTRGWRADAARHLTDSGKGLGLWLCSEIMQALGGRLKVLPTDSGGMTRVRIFLPL